MDNRIIIRNFLT